MATITVDLRALTGTFITDMKRAEKYWRGASKDMELSAKKVGVAIGTATAAAIATLSALTKQAINTGDELAKMSQKVGVGVESLSRLGYAAGQSGVELTQLQSGLVKLAKNASDAAQGTGTAIQGFDALGISVKNADGSLKNTDVLLKEIATQFAGYADGANKTAIAVNLFGRAGAELIPLLNEGADGIEALEERARALGLEISTHAAQESEKFNDLLEDMGNLAKGLGNDLAAELLPVLNALSEQFVDNGIKAREAKEGTNVLAEGIKYVIAGAATAKAVVETLTNVFGAVFDSAVALGRGLALSFQESIRGLNAYHESLLSLDFAGAIDALGESLSRQKAIATQTGAAIKGALDSAASGYDAAVDGLSESLSSIFAPMESVNGAIKTQSEEATKAAPALRDFAKESAAAAAAQKELDKALKAIDKEWSDYASILEDVRRDHATVRDEYQKQQQHFADQARDIRNEIALLGLSGDAHERMVIALEAERLARDQTGVVVEAQRQRYEALLTTLAAQQKISAAAREFENIWTSAANNVGDALTTALFDGADAGADAIKDVMKQLARDLVRFWLQQQIIIPLQQQLVGGIGGQSGGGALGGLGSLLGGAGGSGGMGGIPGLGSLFGGSNAPSAALGGRPPSNLAGAGSAASSFAGGVTFVVGAYNVYDNFRNGPGGAEGALSGAAAGASAGMVFGPWGAAIGAIIGGLAGLLGGAKDPDLRLGGVGNVRKPEETFQTAFGTQQIGVRGGVSSYDFQQLIIKFDTELASIVGSFSDSEALLGAVSARLAQWSVDLKGDAVTVDNVLGSRFGEIMQAFNADVQAFVGTTGTLEERIARLGDAAFIDAAVNATKPLIDNFNDLAAILKENQVEGESLRDTYSRIGASTSMFEAALANIGASLELTRVEFVQFATDITDAAGGLEAASALWSSYFETFYTAEERAAASLEAAQSRAQNEFDDIGRNLSEFTGAGGAEAFRAAIEQVFATGSAEAIVQWLEAAQALGIVLDLQEQVNGALTETADALTFNLEAAQAYAETVQGINRQLYELSGATEFRQSLASIQEQYLSNVEALQSQARAAGLLEARTEDVTAAMQLQARQVAALVRELEQSALSQADALGLTPLSMINSEIAALQESEAAAAAEAQRLGDSIRRMGQISSDVASAMLGDFSPLSGQAKADYALKALQSGAIGLDAALNAGRDVFASGQDFNQFFQRAVGIAQNRPQETTNSGTGGVSLAMRQLLERQTQLQEEAAQAAQSMQARDLASTIADLAFARGEDFQTVIESLGIDLDTFLSQLGFTDDTQLGALITQLQDEQNALAAWFETNITAGESEIVYWLQRLYEAGGGDPLIGEPAPTPEQPYEKEPWSTDGAKSSAEMQDEQTAEIRRLREVVELMSARLVALTSESLTAEQSQANSLQTIAQQGAVREVEDIGRTPRSSRMAVKA